MAERTYETNTIAVGPGKSDSFMLTWPVAVSLKTFETDPGLAVQAVIAGKKRFNLEGGGSRAELPNIPVDGKAYVIVLVKNTSDNPVITSGRWTVTGEGLPEPKGSGSGSGSGVTRAGGGKVSRVVRKTTTWPTPARSQVSILLNIGVAKRLLSVIEGKNTIQVFERPPLQAAFKRALARFRGDEVPNEVEPAPAVPAAPATTVRVSSVSALDGTVLDVPVPATVSVPVPASVAAAASSDPMRHVLEHMAKLDAAVAIVLDELRDLRREREVPIVEPLWERKENQMAAAIADLEKKTGGVDGLDGVEDNKKENDHARMPER